MNILVVCHYGLYQNLSYSFVHHQVTEYAAQGHRVRVLIPNGWGKADWDGERFGKSLSVHSVDGVQLYHLRYLTLSRWGEGGFNLRRALAAVKHHQKRLLEDFQPDVIHAHTMGFDSELGAYLKAQCGCPLVVTTHGSDSDFLLRAGKAVYLKRCCDSADAVVAVSSALMEKVRSCGTETSLYTVLNGFVLRQMPGAVVKDPYGIIQVGRLASNKNVDITMRALALLRQKYPQMTLTVVGAGAMWQQLHELRKTLGLEQAVHFTGVLDNAQVFERLCRATFYVTVSKPEGFGIVYPEAMSAGCLTVGAVGEGVADLIKSGENGFLVEARDPQAIADVIENCLQDPDGAARIAARGREDARALTWRANAVQYLELFEKV